MREIKFRVWDKEYKEMKRVDEIQFSATPEPYVVMSPKWENKEWYKPFSEVILMQYTGLKDKNGKEIYEGDILKYQQFKIPVELNDYKLMVMIRDEYAKFGEVIGNIYENKELLNAKQ